MTEELWLVDDKEDPTRVNAVATCTLLGNEESVTAGTLVTRELDNVVIGVLVTEGVCDVELDDGSIIGVELCVEEVAGAAGADVGDEDEETSADLEAGVEVAALADVDGGVPVTIVVPLCDVRKVSALCFIRLNQNLLCE